MGIAMSASVVIEDPFESDSMARIKAALRGPVTEICQDIMPQLRAYTRREAYEQIMANPELTARCFVEFRRRPELFQPVLLGPDARPVANDDQPLSCGRTLTQVISLIVRAVAKRYFRARLNVGRRPPPAAAKRPSLYQVVFGVFRPPPPPPKPAPKEPARGDLLFQAFRDFLQFEWQLALMPHYVRLSPTLVRALGARILEFRSADQIRDLAEHGTATESTAPGVPVTVAAEPSPPAPLVPRPEMRPAAPVEGGKPGPTVLHQVNGGLVLHLATELGLSKQQLVVCFMRAHEILPKQEFARFVASGPTDQDVARLVAAARKAGLNATSNLTDCGEFVTRFFFRLPM